MKKINVCLRRGSHPIYDDLVKFPPHDVEYSIPKFVTASENKTIDKIKKFAWQSYLNILNKPNSIYIPLPKNVDLIHATAGIIPKNNFPWVIDAEHVTSFVGFHAGRLEKIHTKIEKLLASEYCKKIMPWTDAAKQSIINGLDTKGFKDKIEVVYPAMAPVKIERKKHEGVNLLFVSRSCFFQRGGREVVEMFNMLKKKYDVKLTMITNPQKAYANHPDITFLKPNLPRKVILEKYFSNTDIYIMPTYYDNFGMVFLEAMACGVPIVSTNVSSIPEIVENGINGFLVKRSSLKYYDNKIMFKWEDFGEFINKNPQPQLTQAIFEKTKLLIGDSSLRKRMGRAGRREIERGKFSIKERNKKLRRIYEEAIKG